MPARRLIEPEGKRKGYRPHVSLVGERIDADTFAKLERLARSLRKGKES